MKRMLKVELERATHTIGMLIALIIGLGCVIYKNIPVIQYKMTQMEYINTHNIQETYLSAGFYQLWFPSYFNAATLYLYYFLGIIVVLPFAVSYYRDKKSGVIKNICNRVDKKKYLKAKYFSVFISGGIASAFPLALDFLVTRLITPVDCFEDIQGTILSARTLWKMFNIDHPYVSMLIIIFAWFMFGGALATISLAVSSISNNFFTIQLIPFFSMMFFYYISIFIPEGFNKFLPIECLMYWIGGYTITGIMEAIVIMVITYSIFVTIESRKDIL